MKSMYIFMLMGAFLLAVAPFTPAQQADDDLDAMKMQIQANRRALIAENLMLDESESEGFWRVYAAFHAERDVLVDRRIELLREFRDNFDGISEQQSTQMLDEYFKLQEAFLSLRKDYLDEFRDVLSGKNTLRYYQIESKMDSIIEYDLSQIVPLAQ